MKSRISSWIGSALGVIAAWLFFGTVQGAGLLTPVDGSIPPLSIKDHHVDVVIEEGYAITTVDQVFHNPHAHDLEAHYSFPVPEKGAVSEFTLWIDGKPVVGEVVEKERARRIYQEERDAGRDAGVTEQDAYRTFETFVTPVRANDDTRIRLVYMQPAPVDTGIGRYVYPLEEGGVDEAKLAFWISDEAVNRSFRFDLHIRSAYPVEAVRVPGHDGAAVTRIGEGEWQVRLASNASTGAGDANDEQGQDMDVSGQTPDPTAMAGMPAYQLNGDLVVYWRHQAGLPGSVDLVTYKPEANGTGTFMMVVTPGDDLKRITEGRDWVFVLDMSGSMQGKYLTLADGVGGALDKLRAEDRFRIVLFNNKSRELTPGFISATPEQVRRFKDAVSAISPQGGTNLYSGLQLGLQSIDDDRSSGVVLVTDGVANVGEVQQKKFLELVRSKDIRLFTMVMGNSANRPLLEAMTRHSGGFSVSVSNSDDIVGQLLSATSKVTHEALHDVEIRIAGVRTGDMAPQQIGSLYRGQQLVVFGHYWDGGMADVTLDARVSGEARQYRTRFAFPPQSTENPEIERLWAFASIERLSQQIEDFGEKPDIRRAMVDLATEYSLVTDYTSMLVVRDEVFTRHGIERENRARVNVEHTAQAQRAQGAASSRRVDAGQPMFDAPRASYSGGNAGGGSFDALVLLLLSPLAWLALRRRTGA
jgi:Ca-activated chloride channel family protein